MLGRSSWLKWRQYLETHLYHFPSVDRAFASCLTSISGGDSKKSNRGRLEIREQTADILQWIQSISAARNPCC